MLSLMCLEALWCDFNIQNTKRKPWPRDAAWIMSNRESIVLSNLLVGLFKVAEILGLNRCPSVSFKYRVTRGTSMHPEVIYPHNQCSQAPSNSLDLA